MNTSLVTAALALLGSGAPSGPVTTYSSPVNHPGLDAVTCLVQNLGNESVLVEAVLRAPNGVVAGSGETSVAPGRTVEIVRHDDDDFGFFCEFTFDADPETVRGYIQRRPESGGDSLAVFASSGIRANGVPAPTTLFSPPMRSIGGDAVVCAVQNLSDSSVEVDTTLFDEDGAVVAADTDDAPPGTLTATLVSSDVNLSSYCRFVFVAPPGSVRGFLMLAALAPETAHLVFPAASPGGVGALSVYTPVVSSLAGDATACLIQNLGTQPLMINADQIDSSGGLDSGSVLVMPGHVVTVAGQTNGADNGYCKFDFDSETDVARGYISRFSSMLFADTDLQEPHFKKGGDDIPGVKTYSPPVWVEDGQLHCVVENITEDDVPVHVEIDDGAGAIVVMTDALAIHRAGTTVLTTTADLTGGFCTFTYDGSPASIRTFAVLTNAAGTRSRLLLEAAPRGEAPTQTPTPTETTTPRPTFTHTQSPTAQPTATGTTTPTDLPTATHTPTEAPTLTPTAEPTATPTDIPTAAPTHTLVPAETPTLTPEDTPATPPTATPEIPCLGDCDGDGMVTVDEILRMVNIALGAPLAECPAGDRDGDEAITVDEILAAVANALDGCG